MSEEEIAKFIASRRTAVVATNGPGGMPHLVALWFSCLDGRVYFATKRKSQKIVNLRRDSRVSMLFESGTEYEELRGAAVEGAAVFEDDLELIARVGRDLHERYFSASQIPTDVAVDRMMRGRVVFRIEPRRVRTWDHSKLR